jgi:hypothetical protein
MAWCYVAVILVPLELLNSIPLVGIIENTSPVSKVYLLDVHMSLHMLHEHIKQITKECGIFFFRLSSPYIIRMIVL